MIVSGIAFVVGVAAVGLGVAWLRSPHRLHGVQVRYLGSRRRDPRDVERGAIPRGMVLLVLGTLCLLFVVVTWSL